MKKNPAITVYEIIFSSNIAGLNFYKLKSFRILILGCLLLSVSFTLFSHQDLKQELNNITTVNLFSEILQAKADYFLIQYRSQIKICHFSTTKNELGKGMVKIQTFFNNIYLNKISHFYIVTDLLFSDKIIALKCIDAEDEPMHPIRI